MWNGLMINFFMTYSRSYRNQFMDLQSQSINWFLYYRDLHPERVKKRKVITWLIHFIQLFLYLQKTSENFLFSEVFRGYRKTLVTQNVLSNWTKLRNRIWNKINFNTFHSGSYYSIRCSILWIKLRVFRVQIQLVSNSELT